MARISCVPSSIIQLSLEGLNRPNGALMKNVSGNDASEKMVTHFLPTYAESVRDSNGSVGAYGCRGCWRLNMAWL